MSVPFGGIDFDPIEIGINGNAILGIKESGKSYLATEIGEIFFDHKIPFITFDPIGIWHNMRYPGRGKGYPIVVAGGFHGDMPLTPANAPSIVEAAMKEGVSLVLDLFHPELSKSDWRKIVRDCAMLLLHSNAQYGLRHVFIEEAAEFVPQTVRDGQVFDAVERVIRMGGNSRLGCTLISPRSQEVNKSVLELCENLFLFRQRGKNALENIKKWLDVAGADAKEVMRTLPTMPRGECWAWLGGSDVPVHVKVPVKSSFHPDRRATAGDVAAVPVGKAVNVKKFVGALAKALPAIEQAVKDNDPKLLRARIAELERTVAQKAPPPAKVVQADDKENQRLTALAAQLEAIVEQSRPAVAMAKMMRPAIANAGRSLKAVTTALGGLDDSLDEILKIAESVDLDLLPKPGPLKEVPAPAPARASTSPIDWDAASARPAPRPEPAGGRPSIGKTTLAMTAAGDGDFTMTPARQQIVDKIAWAAVFFDNPAVERQVLGFLIGKHPRTKSVLNDLGALRTAGLVEYLDGARLALTDAGDRLAAAVGTPHHDELIAGVKSALSKRQGYILDLALQAQRIGALISRQTVADHLDMHVRTKSLLNDLGKMKSFGVIFYAKVGGEPSIGAADFLRER